MLKRIPGPNGTTLDQGAETSAPDTTGRAGGTNLHFHPLCSERLVQNIREKQRELAAAKQQAIPSVVKLIGQLDSDPGDIAPETVSLLADTLRNALAALEAAATGAPFVSDHDKAALHEAETRLQDALASVGFPGTSPSRQ